MKRRLAFMASEYLEEVPEPDRPALEWVVCIENTILERSRAEAGEFRERAARMIMEMEIEASRRGMLFPFTRRLLKRLRGGGIRTAVITRNCETAVKMVFPDLEDFCGCFLAREHVERVKPDPEHLRRALTHLGAVPAECLMVGDHPMDVETGKRAGTLTAGVASGSGSWDDLTRSGADWVAADCRALCRELEHLGFL